MGSYIAFARLFMPLPFFIICMINLPTLRYKNTNYSLTVIIVAGSLIGKDYFILGMDK